MTNLMGGWKTWAGGLISIGAGIYLIIQGKVEIGLGFVSGGLTALGIGHKIEKGAKAKASGE